MLSKMPDEDSDVEIDNLLMCQEEAHSRIEKAYQNFKKSPKDRVTKIYCESRLEVLEKLWTNFLDGHTEFILKVPRKELKNIDYFKEDHYEKTEETYFEYKCKLKQTIDSFFETKKDTTENKQVKLPKINVPIFSGKYSEWNTFRDLFVSLIHNRDDLDGVHKLHYLKGYLSGEAEQLLRHVPVADANYERCWQMLEERYNNKKYICNFILKRLFSQKTLLNESPNGLKDLMDTTNDCLSSLKNIGVSVDSWDVIIIHILTLKLDPETRRQWEFSVTDSKTSELPTYNQFKEFLTNRYRAMEFLPSDNKAKFNNNRSHFQPNNQQSTSTRSFHTAKSQCPFCSEEHKIGHCQKFNKESVDSRRSFVQSNNICFCCLGSNHSAKACRYNVRCRTCKGKHHTLLHPMGDGGRGSGQTSGTSGTNNSNTNGGGTGTNSERGSSGDGAPPPPNPEVVSCFSSRKVFNQVLLATALVKAKAKTADIVKMYRQIKVNNEHVDYQRILWRDDVESKISHYRMLRVTFGVASAPYLAVKSLQQVALDEGKEYPMAKDRVLTSFYMDDLLTGCQTMEEGIKVYKEMNELLRKAGFQIKKWTSSNEELMQAMKESESKEEKGKEKDDGLKIKEDEIMKIVGLTWKRNDDSFRYAVSLPSLEEKVITKRKIIADISRFYDPIGWASPSIILPKILIQKLWLAGLDWDEEVPKALLEEWLTYRKELKILENISIPRWVGTRIDDKVVELHGFSDASKVAYAAVVYSRVIDSEGNVHVALISSKTKVAPVKQVSIPRLELCGAVLLTKLMIEIAAVMKVDKTNLHAWTDSTVVLAWLNSHPNKWKVFVANRVSEIITHLDSHNWSHVSTKQNPADMASRGLRPSELINDQMWFQGPKFLYEEKISYQRPKEESSHLVSSEKVAEKSFHTNVKHLWSDFSSLTRLVRVTAYCRRFLFNTKNGSKKRIGFLTAEELRNAMTVVVKQSQAECLGEDIEIVKKGGTLPKSSSLRSLNPYLDDDGILRVGGRLAHSQLDKNQKNPILLSKKSNLSDLIVADAHKQTLHGGPQLMLCYIQTKYWILGAKQLVRACFRKCVTCARNAGVIRSQLMGQLPSARVTPVRAFKKSGVDYAGPIQVRTAKGRGHKSQKAYICLFVCMATRAVHLEVVTDLTSEGFIQAFKRFVARRGYCSDIWSDNGTNFTGAATELKKLFIVEKKSMLDEVAEALATNGVNWHFIPSRSPNFGGLWEAGVKSVKYHLKRVIGQSTLTFEEMSTVLSQVEACLNSRPLSSLPCDDNGEVAVLTPGHFLVGEPLISPPERNYESANISSLRRWQYAQRMLQDFWRQWSREYLTKFYHRYRWSSQGPQPKVDDVVVVKEDGLPPCRWMYGRVIKIHPGADNIVRVVTLKVKNGTLKRPVTKLCLLPISE